MEQGIGFAITKTLNLLKDFKSYFNSLENTTRYKKTELKKLNEDKDGYNGQVRKISSEYMDTIEASSQENQEDLQLLLHYLAYLKKNKKNEVVVVNKSDLKRHKADYESILKSMKNIHSDCKDDRSSSAGEENFVLSVAFNKISIGCNLIISELELITERLGDILKD